VVRDSGLDADTLDGVQASALFSTNAFDALFRGGSQATTTNSTFASVELVVLYTTKSTLVAHMSGYAPQTTESLKVLVGPADKRE
jgi:hypothetical protein